MAISFVGASTTSYGSRTNTTITTVAGIQNGDLLRFSLVTAAGSEAPDPTAPGGLTAIGTAIDVTDGGFNLELRDWYKVASGESGDYTFTHASASAQGSLRVYRGVDTTTPLDATQTQNSGGGTTSTWLGLTTVTAGAWIEAVGTDWSATTNNLSPPAGMTERVDVAPLFYAATEERATAGATGNRTHANNGAASQPWTARLVALRPAAEDTGQTASGGGTLAPLTGTGAATITRKASGGGAMAAFVGGGSGASAAPVEATGAATMAALTGAGAATITRKAAGGATLAAFTGGGAATLTRKASGGATLADFIGAGASNVIRVSSGGGTMAAFTADGAATITRKAAGGATLAAFTGAGQAAIAGQASADGLMAALFGSGAATITRKATGAGVMPFFVGHGTTPGTATSRSRCAGSFRGGFRNIVRGFRARGG